MLAAVGVVMGVVAVLDFKFLRGLGRRLREHFGATELPSKVG